MIKLQNFLKHLSSPVKLRPIEFTYIGDQGSTLETWKLNLALLGIEDQYSQLELVLGELLVAEIEDEVRMHIMHELQEVIDRLINHLHNDYVHEPGVLSKKQHTAVNRIKSIYYLCALIYDGVFNRQIEIKQTQSKKTKKKLSLSSLFSSSNQVYDHIIQHSVYCLMRFYLYLLMEDALIFEKAPDAIWQQLNYLYLYSLQEHIDKTKIKAKYKSHNADSIHEYYLQACVYHLLRPASYRRQDILSLHKVLERWASYISLESDVSTDSKIFVDLNSSSPPEYLTPYSKINPYDDHNVCLFIHVQNLLKALEDLQNEESSSYTPSFEVRLARLGEYTLTQQQFKLRSEARHSTHEENLAVIGLHRIHYHLSGKQPFAQLINKFQLPVAYHPKSRVSLDMTDYEQTTPVTLLDKSVSGYRFNSRDRRAADDNDERNGGDMHAQCSSLLKILSLFALMPNSSQPNSTWQLGLIRWIEHKENHIEAGSRLIGYSITACGVRLDMRDDRSQDFVPALLVAGNETLQTKTNLILPQYHFRENDKVVLRIGNKETKLRLLSTMEKTDDMQQYEIIRLTNDK